ncbi:hypothetical protein [Pseudomonas zhanjiangensis]|uniref:Uncharacterized protein n=1 Tax=Pseudomonas zhanjiangensis TaxID=3239015 RepID=A0ABV3YRZ6_9PSED
MSWVHVQGIKREEAKMDDYQEELLESRGLEWDLPEWEEDATEL